MSVKKSSTLLQGTDKKGDKIYVWVPADKKAKTLYKKATAGITGRQAAKAVQDEGLMSELKEVHLAREGNVLLWEVTYLNKDGQYSLSYVDFKTEKFTKILRLKTKQGEIELNLAKRVSALTPSTTLAITAKAKELKAAGHDVIGLRSR